MPRRTTAAKKTLADAADNLRDRMAKRRSTQLDDETIDWPVLFRVGDMSMGVMLTASHLQKVVGLHGYNGMEFRPSDGALVLNPNCVEGLNCTLDQRVRQWRRDIIWETDVLWQDLRVNYSAVWLLLASLLANEPDLKASTLMRALRAGRLGASNDPTDLRCFGSEEAEHAHRLIQQYLLKEDSLE